MSETETYEKLPLSRREREREARRREILDAAMQLFAEKGFEHTTLDEIAQKAEFGKGTIYHYFKSKEELIITHLREEMEDFIELGRYSLQMQNFSAEQKLRHYIFHTIKLIREDERFFKILAFEFVRMMTVETDSCCELKMKRKELIGIIANIIGDGVKNGEFKPLPSVKTAEFFLNLIRVMNFANLMDNNMLLSDEDMDLIETVFFTGLKVNNA